MMFVSESRVVKSQGCAEAPAGYRIYLTTTHGRILGPAIVIECADDQEAIEKAVQATNEKALELWQGNRFILAFAQ
jgi:coenzyme F420-reducing hydrogenase alpha subunit